MRRATIACAEALLMRTHVIWLPYGAYMLVGVVGGMRRATIPCAAALLMRTHVIWLIYGAYMLVGVCADALLMRTHGISSATALNVGIRPF